MSITQSTQNPRAVSHTCRGHMRVLVQGVIVRHWWSMQNRLAPPPVLTPGINMANAAAERWLPPTIKGRSPMLCGVIACFTSAFSKLRGEALAFTSTVCTAVPSASLTFTATVSLMLTVIPLCMTTWNPFAATISS